VDTGAFVFEEYTTMVTPNAEKALLQSTLELASLVPIFVGLWGALAGTLMFGGGTDGMAVISDICLARCLVLALLCPAVA
jgi:hypothetical protein